MIKEAAVHQSKAGENCFKNIKRARGNGWLGQAASLSNIFQKAWGFCDMVRAIHPAGREKVWEIRLFE